MVLKHKSLWGRDETEEMERCVSVSKSSDRAEEGDIHNNEKLRKTPLSGETEPRRKFEREKSL